MKLLVLDNYDSFTYNLVQLVKKLGYGTKMEVYRNDKIDLEAIDEYDSILLSPGPGVPEEAGIMPALIKRYAQTKKIIGVCLGHQAIGAAYGGEVVRVHLCAVELTGVARRRPPWAPVVAIRDDDRVEALGTSRV